MKSKLLNLLMIILVIGGLGVMFYPTISNWYNAKYQLNALEEYDDSTSKLTKELQEKEIERAREYNASLTGSTIRDPFVVGSGYVVPEDYFDILNINEGAMGNLQIPKINVNLMIYHGTREEVLRKGVGHMDMTAFPVGGEGIHPVLTGHTALPDAHLFTDLNKLELGDQFFIKIFDETLAYEVDNIEVILPSETNSLKPVPGEDLVTLVTCTPYGINTHRLLVRGHRVPYTPKAKKVKKKIDTSGMNIPYQLLWAIGTLLILLILFWLWKRRQKKEDQNL